MGGEAVWDVPLSWPPLSTSLLPPTHQVLALSSGSRKASAVGDVVNLVSVDVQRLTESIIYLNGLWLPLVWIVVCFVYLWQVHDGRKTGFEQSPPPLLLPLLLPTLTLPPSHLAFKRLEEVRCDPRIRASLRLWENQVGVREAHERSHPGPAFITLDSIPGIESYKPSSPLPLPRPPPPAPLPSPSLFLHPPHLLPMYPPPLPVPLPFPPSSSSSSSCLLLHLLLPICSLSSSLPLLPFSPLPLPSSLPSSLSSSLSF